MNPPQEVVDILNALVPGIEVALGNNLVGVYLRGSLATGDFEPVGSDIDFIAVTEQPVSEAELSRLITLHTQLGRLANRYANDLEGTYIPRATARRFRPGERHPTIYRGEALEWSEHRNNWVLERWTVREHGVTLLGPDPKSLIDPISAGELREAVRTRLSDWAEWVGDADNPEWLQPGQKRYVVETMCRALYTLAHGELSSKPHAVAWAIETLSEPWRSTVERSQVWSIDETPDPGIVREIIRFVYWTASQGESQPPPGD